MNNAAPESPNSATRNGTQWAPKSDTRFRSLGLAAVLFLAGAAIGGLLIHQAGNLRRNTTGPGQAPALSDSTKAALSQLHSPIELRFYSLLQPAGVSAQVKGFAGRVDQLLSEYEREGGGRLKVTRFDSDSPALQKSASMDGLKPFSADENQAAYLGLVLLKGSHRECLPLLSPEWEGALESDLTRALLRLDQAVEVPQAAAEPAQTAALEQLRKLVPDLDTLSLEEASSRVREASLAEFKAAATEMEKQVKEAQQKLAEARSGSDADQQNAMKNLQQVQAAQTGRIKELAAKSRAQMDALQKLKTSSP